MPNSLRIALFVLLSLAILSVNAAAEDWPQWMGPNRDGHWNEAGTLDTFPEGGPEKLWSVKCGSGYSGPAVAKGKVYLMDYVRAEGDPTNNPAERNQLVGQERVLCLDANTGDKIWQHSYDSEYKISYPAGPRCTPTVDGDHLYTLGSMGQLCCLTADGGKVIWEKNFPKDYAADVPIWGFCSHPLVYHDLLICMVGGDGSVVVAFDKKTGKEVWRALAAPEPGYCPPSIIEAGGKPQLIVWHSKSVNSLDPTSGEKYWSVDLEPNYGMAIMAPRVSGDLMYAGGISGKSVLLKLDSEKPNFKLLWRGTGKNAVYPVNVTPIVDGDVMYAVGQPGLLRAVEFATGNRLWSTFMPVIGQERDEDYRGAGSGTSFIVKNKEKYFLFAETGHLIIAKLSREEYKEMGRAQLIEPDGEAFGRKVVWSHPGFADKKVFVRNNHRIACYSLSK